MTLEHTLTDPPINYEWYLTGPQGARFILYPVKNKHTEEDVKKARRWLYNNQDVVSLQVRWVKDGDDSPPPEKIPDFIMMKELNKELGKNKAYIEELEEKIQKGEVDERRQLKKEIQSEQAYKQLKAQLTKAQKENVSLRKTISELIVKLNQKSQ